MILLRLEEHVMKTSVLYSNVYDWYGKHAMVLGLATAWFLFLGLAFAGPVPSLYGEEAAQRLLLVKQIVAVAPAVLISPIFLFLGISGFRKQKALTVLSALGLTVMVTFAYHVWT